jgi:hypothetical protein
MTPVAKRATRRTTKTHGEKPSQRAALVSRSPTTKAAKQAVSAVVLARSFGSFEYTKAVKQAAIFVFNNIALAMSSMSRRCSSTAEPNGTPIAWPARFTS